MKPNLILSFISFLFLIILSCKSEDENFECVPINIRSSLTVTKKNVNCEGIDLIWDVSFGVELEVRAISECEENCSNNTIGYTYRVMRNNIQGSDTIEGATTFFAICGNVGGFNETLNTELGEPENYFVGDTIIYEIDKYRICPNPNLNVEECGFSNFVLFEGSPIRASYILSESDFCN